MKATTIAPPTDKKMFPIAQGTVNPKSGTLDFAASRTEPTAAVVVCAPVSMPRVKTGSNLNT